MKPRYQAFLLPALVLLSAGAVLVGTILHSGPESGKTSGEDSAEKVEKAEKSKSGKSGPITDRPLAAFQKDLLDLAFKSSTAIPVNPHIKDRSRAQEAVVTACLELGQPVRARGYIEQIDNWRRGSGYADLACYCARQGDTTEVQKYLKLAEQNASTRFGEGNFQAWRRDRIRIKIARTHALLGQTQLADRFEKDVVDSESGKIDAVKADLSDADAFEEQVKSLDRVFASKNFDRIRNAMDTCAQLFNRFFKDEKRRSLMEERVRTAYEKLPGIIRIRKMMELAGFALDHGDASKAMELIEETQRIVDGFKWSAVDYIPVAARMAGLRYRAGDRVSARKAADAALAMFDENREKIQNFLRARALCPLAAAYQSMGETAVALEVYRRAVKEGAINPNARPRAEDLSATCCSMALHGVTPDAELSARMDRIFNELDNPW